MLEEEIRLYLFSNTSKFPRYADDLLLISSSAEGLQQSLNRLSKYCQEWLLNINPSKMKAIIFQKKSRKSIIDKYKFLLIIKILKLLITYLGVDFSANGSFTNHKEKLKEKTRRSIFATRRYLDFLRLPTNISSKLFDTLFLPILTYCLDVWGVYDKYDNNSWEKDMIEKNTHLFLQIVFSREQTFTKCSI